MRVRYAVFVNARAPQCLGAPRLIASLQATAVAANYVSPLLQPAVQAAWGPAPAGLA